MPPRLAENVAVGKVPELCPLVIAPLPTSLCTPVGPAAPPRLADALGSGVLGSGRGGGDGGGGGSGGGGDGGSGGGGGA